MCHAVSDRLGQQIRIAELDKNPVIVVVGRREVEQQTLSVRSLIGKTMLFLNALGYTRHTGNSGALPLSELLEKCKLRRRNAIALPSSP
ncbi:MAG: His/Gly/Thr/Pro-type tRNA ligase C-terminal domain-containing protein [Leptolyngbyaceae cyanobacterium]